jgi:molecular chaperone DnaK
VLQGEVKDVLLLDVTPLSLGIETLGGIMTKLIQKNTTIPTKAIAGIFDADDSQAAVTIHVLQGEREVAAGNKSLGQFNLEGIPPAPRGMPQIEVIFRHRRQRHHARHGQGQGHRQGKQDHHQGQLGLESEEEIQRMVKDAELHAEDDKKVHELADARNSADGMMHMVKKSLTEYGDKLDARKRLPLKRPSRKLKTPCAARRRQGSHRCQDRSPFASCTEAGRKDVCPATGGAEGCWPGGAEAGAQQAKKDEGDVVDAEFTEVKDKK